MVDYLNLFVLRNGAWYTIRVLSLVMWDISRVVFARGDGGTCPVTEFRGVALNGLFCADVLQPLDLSSSLTLPTNTTLDISNETAQLDVQNCIFFDGNIPVRRFNDEHGGEGKGVTGSSRTKDPHSPITIISLQRLNYSGRRCMWKCHVHCQIASWVHCVWLTDVMSSVRTTTHWFDSAL